MSKNPKSPHAKLSKPILPHRHPPSNRRMASVDDEYTMPTSPAPAAVMRANPMALAADEAAKRAKQRENRRTQEKEVEVKKGPNRYYRVLFVLLLHAPAPASTSFLLRSVLCRPHSYCATNATKK